MLEDKNTFTYDGIVSLANAMSNFAIVATCDLKQFQLNTLLIDLLKEYGISETPKDVLHTFGELNTELTKKSIDDLLKNNNSQLKIRLNQKNGDHVILLFTMTCVPSGSGKIILGIGQDVTQFENKVDEIRLAMSSMETALDDKNKDLALARDRAMAASRAKSGFLANMSHELRTPLNAVIGYSEILIEDTEDAGNSQWSNDLKRIQNAGKHLLSLINDILDLSKIEAGKMGLNLEYFRIDSMIKDVIDTITPMAEKNNTKLSLMAKSDIGVMLSDITKVRQILFNLISNGIKFSEDGEVKIDCRRETESDREHITIEVEDTGIGMSPEDLEKLFEEFFQVDNSNAKKWSGTGLGLVISQRFSQMMGGTISVSSELGKGSTFTVKIPVNTAKIPFQDTSDGFIVGPKIDPRLVRFSGKAEDIERRDKISRVLVIDDDPDVRDLMERYLSREGFEVMSVGSGQEGIQSIREFDPDVITLDVLMPVMDGWSVLSELKKDPKTAKIPVIMLSMMDELDMSFALGASDYLLKPIKRDVLVDTVLKHIRDKENATVMIVDDLEENRNMIARVLSSNKINTTLADNGVAALELLENQIPDLILLDLMMPEMDGFKFSEIVKRDTRFSNIPIVVLTAQELNEDDINRLSGKVERIYEKNETDFESMLVDLQKIVTSSVRRSYKEKGNK